MKLNHPSWCCSFLMSLLSSCLPEDRLHRAISGDVKPTLDASLKRCLFEPEIFLLKPHGTDGPFSQTQFHFFIASPCLKTLLWIACTHNLFQALNFKRDLSSQSQYHYKSNMHYFPIDCEKIKV